MLKNEQPMTNMAMQEPIRTLVAVALAASLGQVASVALKIFLNRSLAAAVVAEWILTRLVKGKICNTRLI